MTQFILKINIGNDAMLHGYDVSEALRTIADTIQDNGYMPDYKGISHSIRDINGNTVGSWRVK